MKLINNRYQLNQVISSDLLGTIWYAKDLFQNQPVRLCILSVDSVYGPFGKNLLHNFIEMASVTHDNLLTAYSLDRIQYLDNRVHPVAQYYYTAEYYEASECISYLTLTDEELKNAICQLCYGLNYIHFRGFIYKYLNFGNVLFFRTDEGLRVRLKELPTVMHYRDQMSRENTDFTQFLSPEVLQGGEESVRSDMYSLGVMLYYLARRIPYENHRFDEFAKDTQNSSLDRLIERLTVSNPAERIGSVKEFTVVSKPLFDMSFEFVDHEDYERLQPQTPLVGRARELEKVLETVRIRMDMRTDTRCILLQGESGIGKTRLIQEASYLCNMERIPTITLSAMFRHESGHFIFANVLRELVRSHTISPELIKKYGSELVKIVPEMSDYWRIKPTEMLTEPAETMRMNDRIYRFMMDQVQSNPMVLFIDNADEISDADFEVLKYLMEAPKKLPLFVVMAMGDDTMEKYKFIGQWIQTGVCRPIGLNKFGFQETVELIRRILGIGEAPFSLAARLMTETEGNPRSIREALKTLFMYEYLGVDHNRQWVSAQGSLGELDLSAISHEQMDYDLMLEPQCHQLLEALSVFDSPAPKEALAYITTLSEAELNGVLDRMVDGKILNCKVGDWGNTYDFYNKRLRKRVLSEISASDRNHLHWLAAEYLEKSCVEQNAPYMESLIHHLKGSQQLDRAAYFSEMLGRKMAEMTHNRQALEFFSMTLQLRKEMNQEIYFAPLKICLGDIYLKLNNREEALILFREALEHAEPLNQFELWVDASVRCYHLQIDGKDFSGYPDKYIELESKCREASYTDGEVKAMLLRCRVYRLHREYEQIRNLCSDGIQKARNSGNNQLSGWVLAVKGVCDMDMGKTRDAFVSLLESVSLLENSSDPVSSVYPIRYLGILCLEQLGEIDRAREYFHKGIELAERMNDFHMLDSLYADLSDTYIREDRPDQALEYLYRAGTYAEEGKHYDIQFFVFMSFFNCYLGKSQYDEAYRYLQKMDYEFLNRAGYDLLSPQYHLCHIRFALEMRDLVEALQWYHRAYDEKLNITENTEFVFRLQKLLIDHLSSEEDSIHNMENHLTSLIKLTTNPVEIRIIREVILNIAIEKLNKSQFESVQTLLDLDEPLAAFFDTPKLKIRREMLAGAARADKVTYYQQFMDAYNLDFASTEHWHVHYVYGREMDLLGDVFEAILHYYYALDVLKTMTQRIPERYRSNFVLNDPLKLRLYSDLRRLIGQILGGKEAQGEIPGPKDVKSYFEISDEKRLLRSRKFLNSALKRYSKGSSLTIQNFEELVSCFGPDEQQNIVLLLEFMTQMTFADRGFLVFSNDMERVVDWIATDPDSAVPDLSRFASNMDLETEGILVRYLDNKHLRSGMKRESLIVIPLSYPKDRPNIHGRRRDEERVRTGKNLGFVVLQSEKPFNNFTEKSFEQCKVWSRTLHAYAENYVLKHFSVIDRLTGTYLRKYMESRMQEEFERCKKQSFEMSIIMADIDHFKNINDVYGHQKGDEVLSTIGRLIRKNLRKQDFVGRYGGEEFMIVLPETDEIDAYKACEKIRKLIESESFLGDDTRITMSFGISSFPNHGNLEEELIERSDQALYESKHMGRNKTTIWTPNIGVSKQRFDKLAGVLEGNISTDSRKIQAMVDLMGLIANSAPKESKMSEALRILMDITAAQNGYLVKIHEGSITDKYVRSVGLDGLEETLVLPEKQLMDSLKTGQGRCFVDWENVRNSEGSTIPDWNSYISVPLIHSGTLRGAVVLSVPISKKEFDFNKLNYVNTLGGVLSVLIHEQEG